ncbi:hypothetical protein [Kitasatospora sp. NPDC101183]|uniref:hypothetical protein n=1 Tax=Kitasatospora sp. NPDC101183 TaxID=3364100 RepID=UPI00380D21E3
MATVIFSLKKIEAVLEIARKDPQGFLGDLARDPFRALQGSGIDLSQGETIAIVDIVKGSSLSLLAPRLTDLRTLWADILADNPVSDRPAQPLRAAAAAGAR